MDAEYKAQLQEQLRMKRKLHHEREMQKARMGMMVDPSITIAAEELLSDIRAIERELGIERAAPAPYRPSPRYEATPTPEPIFQERVAGQQTRARQTDIDHQFVLLKTYRANLSHYRAQSKAFGGIDLAPPITRHGMNEARAGVTNAKQALERLGVQVDDLPGDE